MKDCEDKLVNQKVVGWVFVLKYTIRSKYPTSREMLQNLNGAFNQTVTCLQNNLLQICSQAVEKLCWHWLLQVVEPSLKQAVNNRDKLDGTIRLVTRLFPQDWCSHDITILLQPCVVNFVTILLQQVCIRVVRTTEQVWYPRQACYRLSTSCSLLVDNLEQAVRTRLVDGLLKDFLQVVKFSPDSVVSMRTRNRKAEFN